MPVLDRRLTGRWLALLAGSALLVLLLEAAHLPAALLLGPMIAGVILAASGGGVRIPVPAFQSAQGVVGCLIASSITPDTWGEVARNWPLFMLFVPSVVVISMGLGWLLARWRVLPGTTAIWGSAPGAATAMTLLAESFGADLRLVAFMQYSRVLLVAVAASSVSRLWAAGSGTAPPELIWFPPVDRPALGATLAVAVIGAQLARRLSVPGGGLFLPMVLAILLQGFGLLTITLPPWLLAVSYAIAGWSIGLRFSRAILVHAWRALPRVAGSIIVLIVTCGGLAAVLVLTADIDPLTAYLATSPGGADSVAIIAASSAVDRPFVMAMQTTRFLVVLFTGPALARFVAARAGQPALAIPPREGIG